MSTRLTNCQELSRYKKNKLVSERSKLFKGLEWLSCLFCSLIIWFGERGQLQIISRPVNIFQRRLFIKFNGNYICFNSLPHEQPSTNAAMACYVLLSIFYFYLLHLSLTIALIALFGLWGLCSCSIDKGGTRQWGKILIKQLFI